MQIFPSVAAGKTAANAFTRPCRRCCRPALPLTKMPERRSTSDVLRRTVLAENSMGLILALKPDGFDKPVTAALIKRDEMLRELGCIQGNFPITTSSRPAFCELQQHRAQAPVLKFWIHRQLVNTGNCSPVIPGTLRCSVG